MVEQPSTPPELPPGHRSGFVGIVGRPNVGKSTILNHFLGRKISIVSPKPQTTRTRILGILTRPDAQVIFVDSPGWQRAEHPLGRYMMEVAKGIIQDVDILAVVIDAAAGVTDADRRVFDQVRASKRPALLVLNKIDLITKRKLLPLIDECAQLKLFEEFVPVSASQGINMPTLLTQLMNRLPEGPHWYEPGQVTDQSEEQMIREFVREQILIATRQEVPHAAAILLEQVERKDRVLVVEATILVERDGQKAILIGKGGQTLKTIGQTARLEPERALGTRLYLQLYVKVKKDWRGDPSILRELGYAQ